MDQNTLFEIILGITLVLGLVFPVLWLQKKIRQHSKKTLLKKVVDAVLLPINFGALFLENRKIEQLPFYYRWFLQFTKFTSRIQYFHFLPKAMIAITSEGIMKIVTGQDVLTAIVFSWSILFLIIISIVEARSGEMEEETVVFANKLFLYTVSVLTLFCLIIYFFFWEGMLDSYFNTPFLNFMGEMAHTFNDFLIYLFVLFWESELWIKLFIFGVLLVYILVSVFFSKKFNRK